MKEKKAYSISHLIYVKKIKREKIFINLSRFTLLFLLLGAWELFAYLGIIDAFITSCPSRIFSTIINLLVADNLLLHAGITLYETLIGFMLAVIIGFATALIMWWSETIRKILEPYIVVLNS